jgi:nucleoside-diphosphate-sugar epimerase
MKHALIVGVGGVVGYNLCKHLLLGKDWKVTGICRHKPPYLPEGANVIECDLLDSDQVRQKCTEDKIADVTHLYFVAWLEVGSSKEQEKNNLTMLRNIVEHTERVSQTLKHVYLQTGTKHYGMHLGPDCGMTTPCREDDPRPPKQEGNFYYPMQDYLKERVKSNATKWTWTESRPPWIIGFSIGKVMNVGVSLGVYAMLLKEMGQPLIWPFGDKPFRALRDYVDAHVLCQGIMWMSTHDHCASNAFNMQNGDYTRWEQLWPKMANYFGMEWKMADKPFLIADWIKDKADIWNRICDKHGLQKFDLSQVGTWQSLDIALNRDWDDITLMNKARAFGFHECKDTEQMYWDFFDTLQNEKIIPPLAKRHVGGRDMQQPTSK